MQKKRAVIVEPNRDKRLQLAALLKGEHVQIVMLEGDTDLLADPENNTADLIVLRAEMDRQSGYSICNRLRSNERSQHTKIVIVANAANDPRLQAHRASAQAADAYIVPPLGLKDLRIQAYGLLDLDGGTLSDEDIQAVEEDPLARLDELLNENAAASLQDKGRAVEEKTDDEDPRQHDFTEDELDDAFGALSGQKKAASEQAGGESEPEVVEMINEGDVLEVPTAVRTPSPLAQLDADDLSFVERAFDGVKDAKKAPPLPPGVKSVKELRGPDAKIYQLREKLRERELDIARLQEIWQQHENEYRVSAQRVAEMEIEVKSAQMEAEEAKRKLKEREDENARQQRGSSITIDRLLEEKVLLEKDLIEVVAAKEKNVAELRRMLASRERDITQLNLALDKEKKEHKETHEDAAATLQREIARAASALENERQRAAGVLSDTEARHADALKQAAETLAATEASHAEHVRALEREAAERADAATQKLSDTEAQHADALAALNTQHAAAISALEQEMAKRGDAAAVLLAETEAKHAEAVAALEQEMANRDAAAAKALADAESRHAEHLQQLDRDMALRLNQEAQLRENSESELNARNERTEIARAKLEASLAQRTEELRGTQADLDELRRTSEGMIASLRTDLEAKSANALDLATQLGEARARLDAAGVHAQDNERVLRAELEAAKADREGVQKRLSERLSEREQMLSQKEQTLAELMRELQAAREERDALTQRLSERLREREASIASLEKSLAEMRIDKAQVEERLRVLNEERARIERSLTLDEDAPPPPAPAAQTSSEESIPVADSDESALG